MNIENLDEHGIELPAEYDQLPVFAVGGFVRDAIRGVESHDTDLMVAEVTPSEMRERGFTEVDNDNGTFGVFIDNLGREVAIAREEESTGDGHKDYDVVPVPASVEAGEAVQRDSERRDLTVNSLIYDIRHSVLHDPQNGLRDLEDGIIRAVNANSFKTDPLRIIRACRFAARLGFEIEPTTKKLMEEAVDKL